jgi:hypothetical protein
LNAIHDKRIVHWYKLPDKDKAMFVAVVDGWEKDWNEIAMAKNGSQWQSVESKPTSAEDRRTF